MLTGVDQSVPELPSTRLSGLERLDDRRDFHEIGTCPRNDINTLHSTPHCAVISSRNLRDGNHSPRSGQLYSISGPADVIIEETIHPRTRTFRSALRGSTGYWIETIGRFSSLHRSAYAWLEIRKALWPGSHPDTGEVGRSAS